jgi:hypothetical protein
MPAHWNYPNGGKTAKNGFALQRGASNCLLFALSTFYITRCPGSMQARVPHHGWYSREQVNGVQFQARTQDMSKPVHHLGELVRSLHCG